MSFSNYSQYHVVSRNSANDIKILIINYSQYPVVSRIAANGIKILIN